MGACVSPIWCLSIGKVERPVLRVSSEAGISRTHPQLCLGQHLGIKTVVLINYFVNAYTALDRHHPSCCRAVLYYIPAQPGGKIGDKKSVDFRNTFYLIFQSVTIDAGRGLCRLLVLLESSDEEEKNQIVWFIVSVLWLCKPAGYWFITGESPGQSDSLHHEQAYKKHHKCVKRWCFWPLVLFSCLNTTRFRGSQRINNFEDLPSCTSVET